MKTTEKILLGSAAAILAYALYNRSSAPATTTTVVVPEALPAPTSPILVPTTLSPTLVSVKSPFTSSNIGAAVRQFGNCACKDGSQCVGYGDCSCCDKQRAVRPFGNCTCKDGRQCVGRGDCSCCNQQVAHTVILPFIKKQTAIAPAAATIGKCHYAYAL